VEGSDEGDISVEGSEEYFDESEHVDGFAAEERSTDCEEVDESEGEDDRSPEGSDFAGKRVTRKMAAVRRGVTFRRRRVMRKVARC